MIPKFRVWYKGTEYLKSRMINLLSLVFNTNTGELDFIVEEDHKEDGVSIPGNYYNTNQVIIMQSTGLKDCNGKEIFDGDIVSVLYDRSYDESGDCILSKNLGVVQDHTVKLIHTSIGTVDKSFEELSDIGTVEVVGNIYENKELIN